MQMTMGKAVSILGINRTRDGDLRPMVKALTLLPMLNTDEDNTRLAAARFVLRRWDAYQTECNKARDLKFRRARA